MSMALTGGGLLVPEGALEAAVSRALREYNDELRLIPQNSDVYGRRVYKVYVYNGPDRPATFLFQWGDQNGNPYPLSMEILERVKQLDRNTQSEAFDVDAHNKTLQERRRKEANEEIDAVADYYRSRVDDKVKTVLPRGKSLQAARNRERRKRNPNV